ncbi:DUF87 domain-containing protein [Candidatus Parvarchaeota archaeon]|nr:DUF87 domain-containing protein [Candidatus Parvarchaeota archaeon]
MDKDSINLSKNVNIPAQNMITGRGCIFGQSGSGKSYLTGVILEELCKRKLPFCVIDPEGEYYPLRSTFQVIIIGGNHGDLGVEVDFHSLFRMSIQNNIPVILDLSDTLQKEYLVNRVLSELYLLENELKSPYLVVVEEADKFVPQVRHNLGMIEELAVRGRKRGIGLLLVSQRPANVDKNVLSQCSYGFIGKLTIENDIKAVNIFFTRTILRGIATHNPGDFSSFGLGITRTIHVKQMLTANAGATPKLKRTAAGERLSKVISELKKAVSPSQPPAIIPKKVISVKALREGVDESYIMQFAMKNERKRFGIFGEKIEDIESINKKFISLVLAGIRFPLKHWREYKEEFLLLDDKLQFAVLNGKLSLFKGPLSGENRLLPEDHDVLLVLAKDGKRTPAEISKELGMGNRAVHNSLSRLKLRNLIHSDRKGASLIDYKKFLMLERPATSTLGADASLIINHRVDERIEKEWIRTLFPSATIFECERVLLPIYEVKLKHKDKVRILLIDAVYGRLLRD